MNVLVRTVLKLRQGISPDTGFTVALVGALFGVELLGRSPTVAANDIYDIFSMFAVAMIGLALFARHRRSPQAWLNPVGRLFSELVNRLHRLTFQIGLDMRGDPPVKYGVPPIVRNVTIALLLALAVIIPVNFLAPKFVVRDYLIPGTYVLYIVLLTSLWTALLACIALTLFVPLAMIHDICVAAHRGPGPRPRNREVAMIVAYLFAIFLAATNSELLVAPVLCVIFYAIHAAGVLLPGRFSVQILWRPRESIQVRSLSWGHWVACEFGLIALVFITLSMATYKSTAPLTYYLGATVAWMGAGFLALLCVQMILGRWRDPARPAPPLVHICEEEGSSQRSKLKRHFRAAGLRVSFAKSTPADADATIVVSDQGIPADADASSTGEVIPRSWPLVVSPDQAYRESVLVRIQRRAELQRRRKFFAALESLLKDAKLQSNGGCGFWLSPHFWFITGLMRDARPDETDVDFDSPILTGCVGQPYHHIMPRAVRRHLFEVLRAVQIDLIFIEDGIGFKRLRRALRALFEVYDVHAGRRPAEEIDFRGLPGTRVIIHDYQFDEPFKSENYPEPKYELLARARILHIFRDRGGDEELIEPPFDLGRRPAPVAFPF